MGSLCYLYYSYHYYYDVHYCSLLLLLLLLVVVVVVKPQAGREPLGLHAVRRAGHGLQLSMAVFV